MQYSPRHDALIYDSSSLQEIARVCPSARRINGSFVGVPATLANLQGLTSIGLPVVEPLRDYDWPGRYKPFTAQRVTANFLALNPRSFVLSDMGTGKTLAALWAADFIMRQHLPGSCRAIIVAPLSTLRRVWADEIFQHFLGHRTVVVLHGSADKRLELLRKPADFYVINHDGLGVGASTRGRRLELRGFAAALAGRDDIKIAIVDEASAYRDASTRRHKVARQLIGARPYLWMMTGTPTSNGPVDAYGQAKLLNNAFGETLTSYRNRVMLQVSQFKYVPAQGSAEAVKKLLSPAVRFAIEDCVDLPPLTVQQREAELSPEQTKAYKQLKTQLTLAMANGKRVDAVHEGALRMKLIQTACGALYDSDHETHTLDAAPRIKVLREVIEQSAHKIIVFAPLTNVLNVLYKELAKDYTCEIVNGAVSDKKRSQIFDDFQNAVNPRIVIADPQTMAHGLTLTAATTIIWYAPVDKTEIYLQANKRIHRPGQKNHCTVVQIASTPIEREIYRRLEANETLQGVMLRLAEGG